jgi:hypothetical protein
MAVTLGRATRSRRSQEYLEERTPVGADPDDATTGCDLRNIPLKIA